jgi:ATP-binding cassette subfamily G (WHITE) protein 2 (SNQ2)
MIGVVFENLSVYGIGGVKHFVKTFPDAFVDFFNVYGTVMNIIGKKTGTETSILRDFNGIVKPGEVFLFS